jgi:hypothetical protein
MSFIKDATTNQAIVMRPFSATQAFAAQDDTYGQQVTTVGRFTAQYNLSNAQVTILTKLLGFYTDEMIDTLLRPIVMQTSATSLRVLDWLCTNWSKHKNVSCDDGMGNLFNIHQGYRIALSYFRRRNFDPFRRRLRISVAHPAGDLDSTVGQLNYLAFCHNHGILRFAAEHAAEIEANMNEVTAHSRKRKQDALQKGSPVRRNELTKPPSSKVTVYDTHSRVTI